MLIRGTPEKKGCHIRQIVANRGQFLQFSLILRLFCGLKTVACNDVLDNDNDVSFKYVVC